jgi:tetratricopeptide (TPR) repeat protein
MRGNFEAARVGYRRSRALLEEFGWRFSAALTSHVSAPIEMLAGDLEAAESELRKDYRTLEQMGDRNYLSTAAGLLAEVLYGQGRHQESAEFAGVCRDLGSPDDVASQFLWRSVQAKLLAQDGQHERADAILAEALELINSSDWVDWQGNGFRNLAEIRQLRGRTSDAIEALRQAAGRFAAKGNVVSLRRANELADALRETQQNAPDSAQPAVRAAPRPEGSVAETCCTISPDQ